MNIQFDFDQFIEIIRFYNGEAVVLETMLESIARNEKVKTEAYFEQVIDQPVYFTDDYLRIRRFLIDWYSAYRTLLFFHKNLSDIKYINKVLLLESFGYFFHYLNNDATQEFLCYNLNRLYAYKGTPETIIAIIESANILGFKLFEYWLIKDGEELKFEPRSVFTYDQLNVSELRTYSFSYDYVTNPDPHWQYTASEILALNETEPLKLPSMTPYFGLVKIVNWVKDTRIAMAKIKRTVREQLSIWNDVGTLPHEILYDPTNQTVSLLELYCSWVYAYYLYYDLDMGIETNSGDKVCEITLPQEIVYDNAVYIDEFERHYNYYTDNRSERDQIISERLTDWNTDNYPFKRALEYRDMLQVINPSLYNYITTKISPRDDEAFEALKKLVEYLEFYVALYWDLLVPLHYAIMDDVIDDNVLSLIDFFKPYPSRLIIFDTLFVINDLPGDIMATEEHIEEVITEWDDIVFGSGWAPFVRTGIQPPAGRRPPNEPLTGNRWMFDFWVRDRIDINFDITHNDRWDFNDGNKFTNHLNDITAFDHVQFDIIDEFESTFNKLRNDNQSKVLLSPGIYAWVSDAEDFNITIQDIP